VYSPAAIATRPPSLTFAIAPAMVVNGLVFVPSLPPPA
jgi:hypothetical protein